MGMIGGVLPIYFTGANTIKPTGVSQGGRNKESDGMSEDQDILQDVEKTEEKKKKGGRPNKSGVTNCRNITFIIDVDLLKDIRDYAYTMRRSQKDIFNSWLKDRMEYEKQKMREMGLELLNADEDRSQW